MVLSSTGTCAGIYVLGFCNQRNLPTDGIRIIHRIDSNRATGVVEKNLEIQVPPSFSEQCKLKQALENLKKFKVNTQVK